MNRWIFLTASLVMMVGFQNCAQQKLNDSIEQVQSLTDGAPESEKIFPDGDLAHVDTVEIPFRYQDSNVRSQAEFMKNGRILLSVDNGFIMAVDEGGQQMGDKDHCMKSEDRESLRSILDRANVCRGKQKVADENAMCIQVYQEGYASLYKSSEKIELGSAGNPCAPPLFDLCGEGALKEEFMTLITKVKASWNSMSCVSGG